MLACGIIAAAVGVAANLVPRPLHTVHEAAWQVFWSIRLGCEDENCQLCTCDQALSDTDCSESGFRNFRGTNQYYNCNTQNVMCSQPCQCVVELLLQVPCVVCDDGDAEQNLLMVAGSGIGGLVATVFASCIACGLACSDSHKATEDEMDEWDDIGDDNSDADTDEMDEVQMGDTTPTDLLIQSAQGRHDNDDADADETAKLRMGDTTPTDSLTVRLEGSTDKQPQISTIEDDAPPPSAMHPGLAPGITPSFQMQEVPSSTVRTSMCLFIVMCLLFLILLCLFAGNRSRGSWS